MLVACCTGIGVGLLLVAAVDHNTIREHADRNVARCEKPAFGLRWFVLSSPWHFLVGH